MSRPGLPGSQQQNYPGQSGANPGQLWNPPPGPPSSYKGRGLFQKITQVGQQQPQQQQPQQFYQPPNQPPYQQPYQQPHQQNQYQQPPPYPSPHQQQYPPQHQQGYPAPHQQQYPSQHGQQYPPPRLQQQYPPPHQQYPPQPQQGPSSQQYPYPGSGYGNFPPPQGGFNGPPGPGGPGSFGQYGNGPPPPHQQHGGPPPGNFGGPPQGSYGGGGGGPPPNNPNLIASFRKCLTDAIQENQLQHFYPPNSQAIDMIASRAPQQADQMSTRWRIPREIANETVKLALYDIFLYIDDSGSMQFEENGERIKDLQLIIQRVAYAATLYDDDGVSVRFMNSAAPAQMGDGIKNDQQIESLIRSIQFKGLTPMGTELKNKIVNDVIGKARSGQLRKPVLCIVVTDGQPAGEPVNAVFDTIKLSKQELSRTPYGSGAIAFQFAQVGNDQKAREFLGKLDNDPFVGGMVDCTSNYENESAEMAKANPPVDLTPDLWLVKLLLGAIDSSYDSKDEQASAPSHQPGRPGPGYGGQPGGYGGQPPPPQGGHPPYPPGQRY